MARAGIASTTVAFALVVVITLAGVGLYAAVAPPTAVTSTLTSRSITTSSASASVSLTMVPAVPLVAPGQIQNYSEVEVQALGTAQPEVTLRAFAPAGLTITLNESSITANAAPQPVPFALTASRNVVPANYTVTIETIQNGLTGRNETFTIMVVPELVTMQALAFHPQNITVPVGTRVYWINLDSYIGCCDPGNHDVSFVSGGTALSPILQRLQTWSYLFNTPGTVDYICNIHPYMKGQVTVTG